ncbi:MAG: sigma-70 family RNA polymerase sigma factor [Planctomycetia bacterium]|nr:sigma-70 family RNA polymerase sigma factor [Planctomycetia bacterium]
MAISEKERERAIELFMANRGIIRKAALSAAPVVSLLDDIVNDVFIVYIQKVEQWDFSADIRPILSKLAHDIAIDAWRRHRKTLPEYLLGLADHLQELMCQHESATGLADLNSELSALLACIQKLTPRCRKLLERHYYAHTPLTEIAKEDGENLNTLYSRIDRVRTALRECIEQILSQELNDV